jgi:hypothetical protein
VTLLPFVSGTQVILTVIILTGNPQKKVDPKLYDDVTKKAETLILYTKNGYVYSRLSHF